VHFRLLLGLAAIAFVSASAPMAGHVVAAPAAETWRTYHNERYGTTIDYPDSFKAEPPPGSNDGRAFKNADGAQFPVAASYNALDFDLGKFHDFIVKNLSPGAALTYQAHGDNWFVISGTNDTGIFYEKHLLSHNSEMTEEFVISYPAALKQTYDPIVARMATSFRPGAGFQTPRKP
jgi:hypothetical protein